MGERTDGTGVRLEEWADGDLGLLRLLNSPEMTEHLGGPEPEERLLDRHRRYLRVGPPGTGRMFRIVLLPDLEAVGSIGFRERSWRDETVYETGWGVLPAFQKRGIAVAAGPEPIAAARAEGSHRHLHAFPSVGHHASNAVCRRLGFSLLGACDSEYPKGNPLRCNDWRLELTPRG